MGDDKGRLDRLKGKAKEGAGSVTGNDRLSSEGKTDQSRGKAKEAVEGAKDKMAGVKDSLTGVKKKRKDV